MTTERSAMTAELLRTLNAATDVLGPEQSIPIRTARAKLRSVYLDMRSAVIGSTELAPVDILDMDKLDGMVARWMNDAQDAWRRAQQTKEAVDTATTGEIL